MPDRVWYAGGGQKTCKEGDGFNEDDAGRKFAGSNPGPGEVFSCKISAK